MVSYTEDLTTKFNANNQITQDVSGWETASFHFVGPTGTISITGSNDGGAVTGSVENNPMTADNFDAIQAVNMGSGSAVTAVTTADLYRINPIACKYIRLGGASAQATKLIMFLTKPY